MTRVKGLYPRMGVLGGFVIYFANGQCIVQVGGLRFSVISSTLMTMAIGDHRLVLYAPYPCSMSALASIA